MKRMKGRLLTILMSLAMVFTMMPSQAFAGTSYKFFIFTSGAGSGNVSVYKEVGSGAWTPVDEGESIPSDVRLKIKANPDKYSDIDNNNVAITTSDLIGTMFHAGDESIPTPLIISEDENRQIINGEFIYDPSRLSQEYDSWKNGDKGIVISFKIKDTNTKSIESRKTGEGQLSLYLQDGLRMTPAKRAIEGDTILVSAEAKSGWTLSGLYLLEKGAAVPSAPYKITSDFIVFPYNDDMYQVKMPYCDAEVYAVFTSGDTPVEKHTVTVSGIKGNDKTYDGNTSATFSYDSISLEGVINGDDVGVEATGEFYDKDAGVNKKVIITGITLTGTDAEKYEVDLDKSQKEATASISPKPVEIRGNYHLAVYDGKDHYPKAYVTNLVEGDECYVNMTITSPEGAASWREANVTNFGDKSDPAYTAIVRKGSQSLSNANYTMEAERTFLFQIKKRPITITADDKEGSFAQKPELTWTMKDEQENWFESNRAEIAFTLKNEKGETFDIDNAPAGVYTVMASWETENTNYNAAFVDGKCIIHDWEFYSFGGTDVNGKNPGEPGYVDFYMDFKCTCSDRGSYDEHDGAHWTRLETNEEYKIQLKTDPGCTENGIYVYWFMGMGPDGKPYNKGIETPAPAIGHKYGAWTKLNASQHQKVCEHDKSHVIKENHKWDAGKVTKEATAEAEGVKAFTCEVCKAEKSEAIARLTPKPTPVPKPAPAPKPVPIKVSGTPTAKISVGKTSITMAWSKIEGADGYDIFFSQCNHSGKKIVCKNVKSIKGNKTFTWKKSGLKSGTAYKAYVKVYVMKNGKKTYVKTSPMMHAYTGNGTKKYTNAKSVTIKNVKKGKLSLKRGKTFKIKAKVNKLKKNKKLMPSSHAPRLRFMTTNSKVATVSKSGKITAKGKGTCTIYVYAHNGVYNSIKVTVP